MKLRLVDMVCIFTYFCFIQSSWASDFLPGAGFDSQRNISKESPLDKIEYAFGNMTGGLDFRLSMHSKQRTEEILIGAGIDIGCALLGAEIRGSLKMTNVATTEHFSCEFYCQSSQEVRLNKFSRKAELGIGRIQCTAANFRNKYGDSLLYSLKRGGKLRVTIIASHQKNSDSTDINLSAHVKVLFMKIKAGEVNSRSYSDDNQFTFSVYFSQEGGDEGAKQKFILNNKVNYLGDIESCQRIVSSIFKYASGQAYEDFPQQIQRCPGMWDKEYVSYSDEGYIAFLWNSQS